MVDAAGPPKTIHIKNVPVPRLSRNHVIIALEYAGLGIWDAAQEILGAYGAVKPGTILGSDGRRGTVAAVAADVTNFRKNRRSRNYSYSYGNPSAGISTQSMVSVCLS